MNKNPGAEEKFKEISAAYEVVVFSMIFINCGQVRLQDELMHIFFNVLVFVHNNEL